MTVEYQDVLIKMIELMSSQSDKQKLFNTTDNHGNTPLDLAIQSGNWQVVKILLGEGADIKTHLEKEADIRKTNALHICSRYWVNACFFKGLNCLILQLWKSSNYEDSY